MLAAALELCARVLVRAHTRANPKSEHTKPFAWKCCIISMWNLSLCLFSDDGGGQWRCWGCNDGAILTVAHSYVLTPGVEWRKPRAGESKMGVFGQRDDGAFAFASDATGPWVEDG